ncbi:unnamed protein product (macronuclear) [Paramecium tetraurelia]|uniref:RING-type domain-containing protein n=1 Tax=Paramecium tetraurelia TaxID=5888 RepID=A0BIJ5_PARTE|nr:uncharacterized protein GSPATT00004734001 [Paramecium tetraurelia]CAK58362.1 unnamed protein product [Paramecium tetraurelia]|eukprot:XP_001425760.1 hypothetical protein (macronuclear) [Paramecium tetraurelia strain d4-2]
MRRQLNISQNQQTTDRMQQIGAIIRQKQAFELLSYTLLSNSIYVITVLILCFELAYEGNMLSVIYCIDSKLLLQILHQLYYYRAFAKINVKYNHALIRLFQLFIEVCYVLSLNIYAVTGKNKLMLLSNTFPLINISLSLIVKLNEGNQLLKESVQQINLFNVIRNSCILLMSIFFSLKIEGYLDIDWLYALWVFWLLFSLSASFIIYYIFVVLALSIQVILDQGNYERNQVIKNMWILLFLISCSSMCFVIPISILNFTTEGNYEGPVQAGRIILIANQIVFSYFNAKFKSELILASKRFLSLNDSVNPLHTMITQQGEAQIQQFNKQEYLESQTSEAQFQIPRMVKRISKTYFGFDDLNLQKKSDSKIQGLNKKPTHHKALSSHIQKPIEQNDERIKLASMMNLKFNEQENIEELKGTSILQHQQNENQQNSISLSSINLCCICYDSNPDALFMQCGHGGVCYHCALDMWKNKDECYLCRKKIDRVLQIQICENSKNLYQVVGATQMNSSSQKKHIISQQHDQ